jgi:hypothetical protein
LRTSVAAGQMQFFASKTVKCGFTSASMIWRFCVRA